MACIFCEIAEGRMPCHKVYEDENYLAFLSIFPNTDGMTVVIPKSHRPSYAFELPEAELNALVAAARRVAAKIDRAFPDVGRTALVFEGFGVDHVHAKLFPLHGTSTIAEWKPIHSTERKFYSTYEGYICTHDGNREDDEKLAAIAGKIRAAE